MFCLTLRIPSTGITSQCHSNFEQGVAGLSASKFQSENELLCSKEIAKSVPGKLGGLSLAVLLQPLGREAGAVSTERMHGASLPFTVSSVWGHPGNSDCA